jgi:hypothetical protein
MQAAYAGHAEEAQPTIATSLSVVAVSTSGIVSCGRQEPRIMG